MVTKDEYKISICKAAGFGLMAPFGKVILSIPDLEFFRLSFNFYIFFFISFVLAICATIILVKGYEISK